MGGRLLEGPTMVGRTSDWKDELGRWLKPFLDWSGHKGLRHELGASGRQHNRLHLHLFRDSLNIKLKINSSTSILTAFLPRSARWNEEMDERSARRNHETGCHDGPSRSFR